MSRFVALSDVLNPVLKYFLAVSTVSDGRDFSLVSSLGAILTAGAGTDAEAGTEEEARTGAGTETGAEAGMGAGAEAEAGAGMGTGSALCSLSNRTIEDSLLMAAIGILMMSKYIQFLL